MFDTASQAEAFGPLELPFRKTKLKKGKDFNL